MKKILFTIFTCNRFWYFKNCIESLFEFVDQDRIDILVCDNNTIEKEFDPYCNEISKRNNVKVHKFNDRIKNELYRAMNWSIAYAKKQGYKINNFIQDDFQWVCRNDDLLSDVQDLMSKRKNIVQVNTNLIWEKKANKIGKIQNVNAGNNNFAIVLEKVPCDNGFTKVDVYDEIGPYPSEAISWSLEKKGNRYKDNLNGEVWFGRECKKRGLYRAIAYKANSGLIFDCSYVRGNVRFGNYFPPKGKYYFKPLSSEQIESINSKASKNKFSYIENVCIPDGWKPLTFDKHSPLTQPHEIS